MEGIYPLWGYALQLRDLPDREAPASHFPDYPPHFVLIEFFHKAIAAYRKKVISG